MLNNIFYNLYTYSSYSLLKSNLSINEIVEFSINQNLDYAILTDNNLAGAIEFYYCCVNNKIKPIIGLDWFYCNSHYLLIAKNNNGYQNLLKIESFTKLNIDFNPNKFLDDLIIIYFSGKEFVIKNNNYYDAKNLSINHACCLNKKDLIILDILDCINNDLLLSNKQTNYENTHNFLLTYDESLKYFNKQNIEYTNKIINECNWELPQKSNNKLPKFTIPSNFNNAKDYLEHCCLLGLKNKLCINNSLIDKKYINRLHYELDVINAMGYDDYFLIVADFVNWAKNHNILIGPGRGSAAGSLVAYATNITDIDPIKYNLIFERFLNINRKTLPDIDIDVMDTKRQILIDYIFDKYNPENTSYICAYQHIKAKMAIRDIGRILDIDLKIIDRVSKLLTYDMEQNLDLINNNDDLKQINDTYPLLFQYAKKIINIPRQISTHAAGIIIANAPLWNYVPINKGIDGWQLSEFTMDYLETLGLLKIDILGLRNLSIIDEVLNLIYQNTNKKIDLNKINLNDQKLFNDISMGNTIGIFQLESPGMTKTVMKIKPKSIEDISICSALFRPGPQSLIPNYVKTREGLIQPKYLNNETKEILKSTLGFCIYQEQVIELIKIITNFSTSKADIFRRAISKKQEKLFIEMQQEFINAAIKNNYNQEQAKEIYDFILEFANYGFNHSHSLAYSFISYKMMYLKYYYPLEFFTVLLQYGDSTKNNLYISEAKKRNIKIVNLDIRYATSTFNIFNHKDIMFGFSNIKGFGQEITKSILEIRTKYQFKEWMEIIAILFNNNISLKNIEILVKIGSFDNFGLDRNFILLNLKEIKDKAAIKIDDKLVFDIELNEKFIPMTEIDKAKYEYQYLGYTFSNNKYQEIFNQYQEVYNLRNIDLEHLDLNYNYLIQIKQLKTTMTKYNKRMCFIEFSQDNIDYQCTNFNEEIFNNLIINQYYIVNLKINNQNKIQLTKIVKEIEL